MAALDSSYAYQPLSAEDRMFLSCERPDAHMHLGGILLFEAATLRSEGGDVDADRVLRYVEARLALVPRYRQRLRYVAVSGEPVWIDDDRFDPRYHLRHVTISAPGDEGALKRFASHVMSVPLDRGRPLWQLWFVSGLQDNRCAIVMKVHHCMADGIAGADLLVALLTPQPVSAEETPLPFAPRRAPGRWRLLAERVSDRLRQPLLMASGARRMVTDSAAVGRECLGHIQGVVETLAAALRPAPSSALNRSIGPHRRVDWTDVPMCDVQAIRHRLGGSVNDVALATVAGALRRFLLARDPDSPPVDLRILVPVSTRTSDELHSLGNRVSAWLMTLPVGDADVRRRFATVCRTTAALKISKQHLGGSLLAAAGSIIVAAGLRLVEQICPFNLLVTNVPGPRETFFLLGAPLLRVYPEAPLFPRQGLGIALFGYAGALCIGVHTDCHVIPDIHEVVRSLNESFAELRAVADAASAGPVEPSTMVRFSRHTRQGRRDTVPDYAHGRYPGSQAESGLA